jgi:hypothetical protein
VTVLSNGSVLAAYLPKPRAGSTARTDRPAARTRRGLRDRLRGHGRQIKDGAVATIAFGCCDFAAFTWHPWAGWLATGLSLFLIDHAVDRAEVSDVGTP